MSLNISGYPIFICKLSSPEILSSIKWGYRWGLAKYIHLLSSQENLLMSAYLPSQWSWEFLHNVRGSRIRRFRMVDMCKGIQKDWLQGTSIVLVVELHMVGIEDIVLEQQGDISLHFSNHRIPSFILFFSSHTFFFLSSFLPNFLSLFRTFS